MVSFSCDKCGQIIKKPKLDGHLAGKCFDAKYVACIDCHKRFHDESYRAHTSCISEEEKHHGALYKGKKAADTASNGIQQKQEQPQQKKDIDEKETKKRKIAESSDSDSDSDSDSSSSSSSSSEEEENITPPPPPVKPSNLRKERTKKKPILPSDKRIMSSDGIIHKNANYNSDGVLAGFAQCTLNFDDIYAEVFKDAKRLPTDEFKQKLTQFLKSQIAGLTKDIFFTKLAEKKDDRLRVDERHVTWLQQ